MSASGRLSSGNVLVDLGGLTHTYAYGNQDAGRYTGRYDIYKYTLCTSLLSSVVERATRNGEVGCSIQPGGTFWFGIHYFSSSYAIVYKAPALPL